MALSISTSRVLYTPVNISNPGINQDDSYISSYDHSLTYTTGAGDCTFTYDADDGSTDYISYIGISGHNLSKGVVINAYNNSTLIATHTVTERKNNIMMTFTAQIMETVDIEILQVSQATSATISYIVGGEHLSIATGEQSGYKRLWLNRGLSQKATMNGVSAPVSTLQQSKELKGNLSLPNQAASFSQDDWQDFIDYAYLEPFFIKEIESKPESSYLCFNPSFGVNSHGQTLALNALTVSFTAYNGV